MLPTDSFRLDGRIALVTGASSGIGAALAEAMAAVGAITVLAARRTERLEALAARITAAGGRAHPVALDVTDADSIEWAFASIDALGGPADILVNAAGVAEPKKFLGVTSAQRDQVFATNFIAPWDLSREFARRLVAVERPGSIINIASILGLGVGVGYSAYAASKSALIQLTRSLALELIPQRIRVNAIAPGWFVSEMNEAYFLSPKGQEHVARMPPRRTGEMRELVGPALLLASDAGSYVNGVVLPVDGGHSIALI